MKVSLPGSVEFSQGLIDQAAIIQGELDQMRTIEGKLVRVMDSDSPLTDGLHAAGIEDLELAVAYASAIVSASFDKEESKKLENAPYQSPFATGYCVGRMVMAGETEYGIDSAA